MDTPLSHLRTVSNRDGAAVLDVEQGTISTLNSTGAFVWSALQRGDSIEVIVTTLAQQTGAERSVVENDVASFVEALRKQHLLKDEE